MATPTQAPLVKKYVRHQVKLFLGFLLAFAVGVVGTVFFASTTISKATASFETVTVTATGEHETSQTVGSRRNRHIEQVRIVEVTLPDGSEGEVRSDTIKVGETATVYRSEEGRLFEEEPEGAGVFDWIFAAVVAIITLILLAAMTGPLSKIRAVRRLRDGNRPTLLIHITGVENRTAGKKIKHHFTAIVRESTVDFIPAGSPFELDATAGTVPQNLNGPLRALVGAAKGPEFALVLALAVEGTDEWWMAHGQTPSAPTA
ncbi:hypothetical protein [Stackebrandtia soli]|uniref:hypothetical protein n=1 Tax=Stackebrandtia soli TaxID=1892856 RepID=UPI0039E91320